MNFLILQECPNLLFRNNNMIDLINSNIDLLIKKLDESVELK